MSDWMRGGRGLILLVVLWVGGWFVGFGGVMEAFVDPHGELVDIWPALMGFAGLVAGIVMAVLLGLGARGRSLAELSWGAWTAAGAVSGLVLGAVAVFLGLSDDLAIDTAQVRPIAPLALVGVLTLMAVVGALVTSLFFRLVGGQRRAAVGRV